MSMPLFCPAGTIVGPDMARQIVIARYGVQWTHRVDVFAHPETGDITDVRSRVPDFQEAMRKWGCAYRLLLTALASGALVAEVEAVRKRYVVSASYWDTGSGSDAIINGKIGFTGGPPPGLEFMNGCTFFVDRQQFAGWLKQVAGSENEIPQSSRPGPKPTVSDGIAAKMFEDLCSGRETPEGLQGHTLEVLSAQYGGALNTAKKARDQALAQFSQFQNSNSENL